jgi:hypothetical protein
LRSSNDNDALAHNYNAFDSAETRPGRAQSWLAREPASMPITDATFRAIAKKYPNKRPDGILRDLITSTPGAEGKWFAAAKDAGLFDVAIELVTRSPTDPRTLTRAARDYAEKQPDFALAAGLAALHWISRGQVMRSPEVMCSMLTRR